MTWTDKLILDVDCSCEDHMTSLDFLHRLQDCMISGQGKELIGDVIDTLVSHVHSVPVIKKSNRLD